MAAIPIRKFAAGALPTTPAAIAATAGGDTLQATNRTMLTVINGGGGSVTVTIPKAFATVNFPGFGDVTLADITLVVGAGTTGYAEIPPQSHAPGGIATISYSGVTSVTVFAIEKSNI